MLIDNLCVYYRELTGFIVAASTQEAYWRLFVKRGALIR